ncbi:MAG: Gfo/Idh/MocA family oxidoreductase, partial [Planctomycetales bacterium]|nr:Gfo/Idh/MocA family oxidoreductase [Planctomycetales bacterium]
MSRPIRTAIIGLTHDHVWDHLPQLAASAGVDLVGAAEPRADVRERFQREYRLPASESYDEVLSDESLEAVWVFADNRGGAELAAEALRRNLHVVIEKPMADSLANADRMLAAAISQRKRLIVNWPFAWWPQLQVALQMAASGALGPIWQVRYRAAHAGPRELGCSEAFCDWLFDPWRNGQGGAMMDYCCYGALLAAIVLGSPSRVTG